LSQGTRRHSRRKHSCSLMLHSRAIRNLEREASAMPSRTHKRQIPIKKKSRLRPPEDLLMFGLLTFAMMLSTVTSLSAPHEQGDQTSQLTRARKHKPDARHNSRRTPSSWIRWSAKVTATVSRKTFCQVLSVHSVSCVTLALSWVRERVVS
jgi:hypothetical protein